MNIIQTLEPIDLELVGISDPIDAKAVIEEVAKLKSLQLESNTHLTTSASLNDISSSKERKDVLADNKHVNRTRFRMRRRAYSMDNLQVPKVSSLKHFSIPVAIDQGDSTESLRDPGNVSWRDLHQSLVSIGDMEWRRTDKRERKRSATTW